MVKCYGNLISIRDLRYGYTLRGPISDKGSGSVVLAVTDAGPYVIVRGTAGGQTVTLPEIADLITVVEVGIAIGRYVEIYNAGTFAMEILPSGSDILRPVGNAVIQSGERLKLCAIDSDVWFMTESGNQLRDLQELHHVSLYQDHDTGSYQTAGLAAGDPPSVGSATKLEIGSANLVLDNGYLMDAANHQLVIQHDAKYRLTCNVELACSGGDTAYIYLVKGGTSILTECNEIPNGHYAIASASRTIDLVDGDIVDFRVTSNTNALDVHGYDISLEQITESPAQSKPPAEAACYVYTTPDSETTGITVNKAIPFTTLQSSVGSGVSMDGNGLFTLSEGVWFARGGVYAIFTVAAGALDYIFQDVTGIGSPITAAGTKVGLNTSNWSSGNAIAQYPAVAHAILRVRKGQTRVYKLAPTLVTSVSSVPAGKCSVLTIEKILP